MKNKKVVNTWGVISTPMYLQSLNNKEGSLSITESYIKTFLTNKGWVKNNSFFKLKNLRLICSEESVIIKIIIDKKIKSICGMNINMFFKEYDKNMEDLEKIIFDKFL